MVRWYRLEGHTPVPTTSEGFEVWLGPGGWDSPKRLVAKDTLADDTFVSTVFLGLDHSHTLTGPPILFETMVFWPQPGDDPEQERYATWDEAAAGHARWVERARNAVS